MREDVGTIWAACGVACEWAPLREVLLHRPGAELAADDPNAALMLERPDPERVRAQHDGLAAAYRAAGITVHYVDPWESPPPNQVFVADIMLATPEGVIVGRPASPVRAPEARWVARRLAEPRVADSPVPVVGKCTLCVSRLEQGLPTACASLRESRRRCRCATGT